MRKSNFLRTLFLITVLFSFATILNAQESENKKDSVNSAKRERTVKIIPLPVIAFNPTAGFMFGFVPAFNWYMGDKSNTSMSTAFATAIYTTNKQAFFNARANTFLAGDGWNIMTDVRFLINSLPTYGLGTGDQFSRSPVVGDDIHISEDPYHTIPTSQMIAFNHFRFYQTVLHKHEDTRLFYGVGYHLDAIYRIKDHLLDLNPADGSPPVITHHFAYNNLKGFSTEKYTQSGISANILYDSRDNIANPYTGRYAFLNFRVSPMFLGSTKNSSVLWAEYRDYINLSAERPRHLIAFWTYGNFVTGGKVPYLLLPGIGMDMFSRSGRPYTLTRFRGEDLVYGETEYRFPLQKHKDLLGGVLFVNAVSASSRTAGINIFQYIDFAYGGGLRVMIDKKSRVNLTVDYGFGVHHSQALFIGVNEVF